PQPGSDDAARATIWRAEGSVTRRARVAVRGAGRPSERRSGGGCALQRLLGALCGQYPGPSGRLDIVESSERELGFSAMRKIEAGRTPRSEERFQECGAA